MIKEKLFIALIIYILMVALVDIAFIIFLAHTFYLFSSGAIIAPQGMDVFSRYIIILNVMLLIFIASYLLFRKQ